MACQIRIHFPFVLVLLAWGCASNSHDTWVSTHGGTLADARQRRVERVSQPFLGRVIHGSVRFRVLNYDTACAFGWPDGRIYLTRSLVDLLDDQELAAAIAHELGHLVVDGHLHGAAALRGCERG